MKVSEWIKGRNIHEWLKEYSKRRISLPETDGKLTMCSDYSRLRFRMVSPLIHPQLQTWQWIMMFYGMQWFKEYPNKKMTTLASIEWFDSGYFTGRSDVNGRSLTWDSLSLCQHVIMRPMNLIIEGQIRLDPDSDCFTIFIFPNSSMFIRSLWEPFGSGSDGRIPTK